MHIYYKSYLTLLLYIVKKYFIIKIEWIIMIKNYQRIETEINFEKWVRLSWD